MATNEEILTIVKGTLIGALHDNTELLSRLRFVYDQLGIIRDGIIRSRGGILSPEFIMWNIQLMKLARMIKWCGSMDKDISDISWIVVSE